jgi:integrase
VKSTCGSARTRCYFAASRGANGGASVQRLLGHSDPKITERRYGHLLPDFMQAEVNRLRFGLDRLAPFTFRERAPAPGHWQHFAGLARPSPAAWYTGGTVGPNATRRGRNAL